VTSQLVRCRGYGPLGIQPHMVDSVNAASWCESCMRKINVILHAKHNTLTNSKSSMVRVVAIEMGLPVPKNASERITKRRALQKLNWTADQWFEVEAEADRRLGTPQFPDTGGISGNYDEAQVRAGYEAQIAETRRQLEEERIKRRAAEKRVRPSGSEDVGTEREELHVRQEKTRLESEGQSELAAQVRRTHPKAPGYDVISFVNIDGTYEETHDEVKGPGDNHLSPNEADIAKSDPRWRQVHINEKTGDTKIARYEKPGWVWEPTGAMKRVKLRNAKVITMERAA
jgi:hypothetical protein